VAGQYAAAVVQLQCAIDLGHLPSLALKAWLHIYGREGVALDHEAALKLAEEGARLGCHHCQGVMANCYFEGWGCEKDYARSLELARESSGRGSRYGQHTLGELHHWGRGGLAEDFPQALMFYMDAAVQGLDQAQVEIGEFFFEGDTIVPQDYVESLRWYQLAAAQGHPDALYSVAHFHAHGLGVRKSKAAAIRWYKRAQAAGHEFAADELQSLRA